jgi:hypothetical protein
VWGGGGAEECRCGVGWGGAMDERGWGEREGGGLGAGSGSRRGG